MFTVILILILVLCVVLALVVLVQNPKGGGLSGTFGGAANQIFGYKRTSDDIEKITWGLAVGVIVLSLATAAFIPSTSATQDQILTPQAEQPLFQAPPSNESNNGTLDNSGQTTDQPASNEPLPTE